jgi:outer membrane lipoprotein SlyB
MKRIIIYVVLGVLALAVLGTAAVAYAHEGGLFGRGVGGRVTAIDGNTLTVENPQGDTGTIVTNSDTQFTVNGEDGSLADISVGMFAGARGEMNEDSTQVTATQVRASDEMPRRKDHHGVGGEVTAINGDTITVKNPHGDTGTIVTNSDTQFIVNGEDGSLADISVGMFAGARGEMNEDGTQVTATQVRASDEMPHRKDHHGVGGEVTAINGDTITVKNPHGDTGTIVTNNDTEFTVNGEDGSLSDIKEGMFAGARGEMNEAGTQVTATQVLASDEMLRRGRHGRHQIDNQ